MEEKVNSPFEIKVEGALAEVLLSLSKWIKVYVFIAVVVNILAMGVSILYVKLLLPLTTTTQQNSVIISLVFMAMHMVSCISLYFMYLFGAKTTNAIRNDSTETLQYAFNNFKMATIIAICIQVINIAVNTFLLYDHVLLLLHRK